MHEKEDFDLFYRVWYCVIISQITFCGIVVEIIWSQNYNNFFFWLQIYSGYSVYTCLSALIHNKHERYLALGIVVASILVSRLLYFLSILVCTQVGKRVD
jgi:hypothetical protein